MTILINKVLYRFITQEGSCSFFQHVTNGDSPISAKQDKQRHLWVAPHDLGHGSTSHAPAHGQWAHGRTLQMPVSAVSKIFSVGTGIGVTSVSDYPLPPITSDTQVTGMG